MKLLFFNVFSFLHKRLNMFKAILGDVSLLRDSLDAISSLATEGTFTINSNGLQLVAMDPASVSMAIFNLLSTAFVDYKIEGEKQITVNLDYLVQILKRASVTDQIFFELNPDKNALEITMKSISTRRFLVPLLNDITTPKKVPELEFPVKLEIETNTFKDGIKDASMVSDCVVFNVENNTFSMIGKGDVSETKLELTAESPALISINHNVPAKSKYAIEYLDKFNKASKLTDRVVVQYNTDYPLQIEFKALDKLSLKFILAPRVEND